MNNKKYVSPSFLSSLISNELDRDLLRILAKEIPKFVIYEACAKSEITPEEGVNILMLQRESNYWIIRQLHKLFNYYK